MAHKELRAKAVALRLEQKSYSEIKAILGVPKGTLSDWLRDLPLSRDRINELRGRSEQRIERYRSTRRKHKEERLTIVSKERAQVIFPLSERDIFIAGYMLYWGEGYKSERGGVGLANTDPSAVRMFISWLEKCFDVPREKMKLRLHLYSDMDHTAEHLFWKQVTGIPEKNFRKPYVKESKLSAITYKGMHGHGTCNIMIGDVRLREKIIEGIKLLQKEFGTARVAQW